MVKLKACVGNRCRDAGTRPRDAPGGGGVRRQPQGRPNASGMGRPNDPTAPGFCEKGGRHAHADLQSRQQLLVFGAEHGQEAAEDYIDRLWQGGLGAREPITEVMLPCTNARITHLVTKALSRCNAITNDVYKLRGPVRAMQQAMQPAVQTASPTPTEEEAEEDPYDEATRIMREMEQDPPADF